MNLDPRSLKIDPYKLVDDAPNVPSLPLVYEELNQAINDPSSSSTTIGDVIGKDAGLAARLLRIANSALYSFPSRIDTISQAIIVIGIQQLRDLTLGTSVIELFEGISIELVNMDSFWRHSIACGICARVLATYRREANVERYFVAGLLHDIGRLIMYLKLPDHASESLIRCKTSGELMYKVEREFMECDHCDIGSALLQHWKLPTNLVEGVMHHHYPLRATRYPIEASLVHIADIIANAMQIGTSGEHFVPPLVPETWERSGLSPSILAPTLAEVDRQMADMIEMLLKGS
ncbi:MAG: HDOD domain-containing protein [Verrucomicrobiae bacterium]|nr:HDOD domain-containing protein [Verrucomicrobiae bacterium]